MLVTADLIRRIEAFSVADAPEFAQAAGRVAPAQDIVCEPVADGVVLLNGPNSYANHALGLGLHGAVGAGHIDRVEELSRGAGVPPKFEVCPLADPTLLELLAARCYRVVAFRTVLVRELADLSDLDGQGGPDGLEVALVDAAALPVWKDTAIRSFELDDEFKRKRNSQFVGARFHVPGERLFVASVGGEPVANAGMCMRNGVVALGGMGTVPEWRGRGIQGAVVRHRLRAAADEGCDLAVVAADPGTVSERNLQRYGFRIAYTETFFEAAPA